MDNNPVDMDNSPGDMDNRFVLVEVMSRLARCGLSAYTGFGD